MISFFDLPGLRRLLTIEPEFGAKMAAVAESLGLNPNLIMNIMSLESGLNPKAINPVGGASGLIQFMPKTARDLGTTVEAIRQMSGVEQLDLVKKFFAPHAKSIAPNSPGDYYMTVFMPAYIGKPPSTVLGEKGSTEILPGTGLSKGAIYEQNTSHGQPGTGLDVDGDGRITIADVTRKAEARAAQAAAKPRLEVAEVPLPPEVSPPKQASVPPQSSSPPAWRSSGGPSDLPVLRIGARGTAVTLVQVLLRCDVVTGVYTDAMAVDYVRPFQSLHGLTPDAVIGPKTWEAIASPSIL